MIEVQGLTKHYGPVRAVDDERDVELPALEREVLDFILGPSDRSFLTPQG